MQDPGAAVSICSDGLFYCRSGRRDDRLCVPAAGALHAGAQVLYESELVANREAPIRRIAPNREALNKSPNRESPINLAGHLW